MENDIAATAKSFWDRPEGKPGAVVLAAGAVGATYGLYLYLPKIITLLENVYTAGALLGGLAVLTSPLYSTTVRTAVTSIFRVGMRKLTGLVIELDPIGILKNYVRELLKDQQRMREQIGTLEGQIVNLKKTIQERAAEKDESINRARAAASTKDKKYQKTFTLNNRKAKRLADLNVSLDGMLQTLEKLLNNLKKLDEYTDLNIEDLKHEVEVAELKFKTMKAGYGAFKSAMNILQGNDGKSTYDQTMEFLADDYAFKVGQISSFMERAEGAIGSMDLDNLMIDQEALKMFDELDNDVASILGNPAESEQENQLQALITSKR